MKVFLINGHQRYEGFAEGKLNQTIIDATEKQLTAAGHEVKTTIVLSSKPSSFKALSTLPTCASIYETDA